MFDWNHEELSSIIWDEDGKSDDHIVPYLEGSEEKPQVLFGDHKKKEWKRDTAIIKTEQGVGEKTDFYSQFDTNEGLSASGISKNSWPDVSLSDAANINQDSTEADTTDRDKDYVASRNRDQEKDENDLLEYGWDNIGSFDDLDRIFSNDDPLFGPVSLGNGDESWLSPKDVINSPVESFPLSVGTPTLGLGSLRNASEQSENKMEFMEIEGQSFTQHYGNMHEETSHGLPSEHPIANPVQYCGSKSKLRVKEQMALDMVGKATALDFKHASENVAILDKLADVATKQKKALKCQKRAQESHEDKLFEGFSSTLSPVGSRFQPLEQSTIGACLPFVLNRHRQFQEPEYFQNHRITNQLFSSSPENLKNQCSAISTSPCLQFGGDKNPKTFSGPELYPVYTNPFYESVDSSVKPPPMTPKEKVEKLRRRQQMQAMLAIKKQQEQFNHEISSSDHSITQKCPLECPIPHVEKTDTEIEQKLNSLPILDPYFSEEQDVSNTTPLAADEYSVEDAIFHRLLYIIERLDIRIRICIRNSLFRLAQSAMQRHYESDTSSTNRTSRQEHEAVVKEEINSHTGCSSMPEMETETNPIDRVVAHLLFQRHSDLSGKPLGATALPVSSMLPHECITPVPPNLSMGCLSECSKNKQLFSQQGSKAFHAVVQPQQVDQFERSPTMDASETALNNEPPTHLAETWILRPPNEERQTAE